MKTIILTIFQALNFDFGELFQSFSLEIFQNQAFVILKGVKIQNGSF